MEGEGSAWRKTEDLRWGGGGGPMKKMLIADVKKINLQENDVRDSDQRQALLRSVFNLITDMPHQCVQGKRYLNHGKQFLNEEMQNTPDSL